MKTIAYIRPDKYFDAAQEQLQLINSYAISKDIVIDDEFVDQLSQNKRLNERMNVTDYFQNKENATLIVCDVWVLSTNIEDLTQKSDKAYTVYDFNHPAQDLRKFLWGILASNFIELVKNRTYNENKKFTEEESKSAKYTLHFLLERLLILLYPIIPQITTLIAKEKKLDLLSIEWPEIKIGKSDLSLMDSLIEFNGQIWKAKKDQGISLRNPIKEIKIPKELAAFEKDLRACHNI